jgi:hypothetical protein
MRRPWLKKLDKMKKAGHGDHGVHRKKIFFSIRVNSVIFVAEAAIFTMNMQTLENVA